MSIISGPWAAESTRKAQNRASETEYNIARESREQTERLLKPFWESGVEAVPEIETAARTGLPSYEEMVSKPMDEWDYAESPAYQAKYSLAMERLNDQLAARGILASGRGATYASDMARKLTAEDYEGERSFRQSQLSDKYRNSLSENTTRYNRLLDLVKAGQGAAGTMGQANNQFSSDATSAARARGQANASFYSGMGGLTSSSLGTGLRAYDYGKKQGWWGTPATTEAVAGVVGAGYATTAEEGAALADYYGYAAL